MGQILCLAMILTGAAIASGALKADKRDAAAMVLRRAQQTLGSYVTVAPTDPTYSAGSPVGRWPADASGQWALRNGTHDITSLLTGTQLAGTGALFTYTVSSNDCLGTGGGSAPNYEKSCKTVIFNLTYPD